MTAGVLYFPRRVPRFSGGRGTESPPVATPAHAQVATPHKETTAPPLRPPPPAQQPAVVSPATGPSADPMPPEVAPEGTVTAGGARLVLSLEKLAALWEIQDITGYLPAASATTNLASIRWREQYPRSKAVGQVLTLPAGLVFGVKRPPAEVKLAEGLPTSDTKMAGDVRFVGRWDVASDFSMGHRWLWIEGPLHYLVRVPGVRDDAEGAWREVDPTGPERDMIERVRVGVERGGDANADVTVIIAQQERPEPGAPSSGVTPEELVFSVLEHDLKLF